MTGLPHRGQWHYSLASCRLSQSDAVPRGEAQTCSMNYDLLSTKPVLRAPLVMRFRRRSGCFEQIRESDRLVAMRALGAGSDATAKHAAVRASLIAKIARRTLRALVHRSQTGCPRWKRREWSGMTLPPGHRSHGARCSTRLGWVENSSEGTRPG